MSKFEVQPSRAKKIWALLLGILSLGELIFTDKASMRLVGAAMLLGAWELAYVPSLPLNLTLGEIYQKARQGWRMSRTARIINYVTFGLIALSIFLKLHGR